MLSIHPFHQSLLFQGRTGEELKRVAAILFLFFTTFIAILIIGAGFICLVGREGTASSGVEGDEACSSGNGLDLTYFFKLLYSTNSPCS